MKHQFRLVLLFALSATAWVLPACSSSTDTSSAILPPAGPAMMSIVSPKHGDCAVLWADEQTVLPVTIAVTNWLMRPIAYCGAYPQCGHVIAFADDVRVAEASALVIDVPLTEGDHTVRIELRDDADVVGVDGSGMPLQQEITIHAVSPWQSCGADAGSDAPSQADASSEL